MRVLGVDPSSTRAGAALVEFNPSGERLLWTAIWTGNPKRSQVANLSDFFAWTVNILAGTASQNRPVDLAVVELVAVARNLNTVRVLARFEAAALLALRAGGVPLIREVRVGEARAVVLGDGGVSKEEAHQRLRERFSGHRFRQPRSGGLDETDALTAALAGPQLAERA